MPYYMVEYGPGTVNRWERCDAETLTAAKREAALRFGDSYRDHEIRVGVGPEDLRDGPVDVVSRRAVAGGRWRDEAHVVDQIRRSEAAAALGRAGGAARSEAKARAARDNGRKGGRPRTRPH